MEDLHESENIPPKIEQTIPENTEGKSFWLKIKKNYVLILAVVCIGILLATIAYIGAGQSFSIVKSTQIINPGDNQLNTAPSANTGNKIFDQMNEAVMPPQGFQSKIFLHDAILKLAEKGVIDKDKFVALYKDRGGLPKELQDVFDRSSDTPMKLTIGNANVYVNLLWPLGLSNYMPSNKQSPVNGKDLYNFASTGGWNLGKQARGGVYFNKFSIVPLTAAQEALVMKVAQSTYRPCCNNSTFFQDCNHGSALLGVLELGAAQGLNEKDLYLEALAFNSFWFPTTYIQMAVYFKVVKNIDWKDVDPQLVMSKDYSSISGFNQNVSQELIKRNLVPAPKNGPGCST